MHSCDREGPSCEEEGTILSKENSSPCAEEIGIHGKPAAEGCRSNAGCDVSPVSAPIEKKRFEWIDNARIVAALLIIYVHMPWFVNYEPSVNNDIARDFLQATTFYGRVPFFLILGGYFLGRRITWSKALDRAIWLLIPFLIWNFIYYFLTVSKGFSHIPTWQDFLKMSGIGVIFTRDIHIFGLAATAPCIKVSWFLRDIVILSLLTPILVRFKHVVLIGLVIVISYTPMSCQPDSQIVLSPGACFFYLLGTTLSQFRVSDAYLILNKRFNLFLVLGFVLAAIFSLYATTQGLKPMPVTLVGCVFGALMIGQCGILIETHFPRFSKMLAPCGPACFLVFMLQEPLLKHTAWMLPRWYTGCWLVWTLPFFVCAFLIFLFLMMKRYAPWLLPYLGHMKVPGK